MTLSGMERLSSFPLVLLVFFTKGPILRFFKTKSMLATIEIKSNGTNTPTATADTPLLSWSEIHNA